MMLAAKRVIDEVNPRWWVIENVRGAVEFFEPHLGRDKEAERQPVSMGRVPHLFDCSPGWEVAVAPDSGPGSQAIRDPETTIDGALPVD